MGPANRRQRWRLWFDGRICDSPAFGDNLQCSELNVHADFWAVGLHSSDPGQLNLEAVCQWRAADNGHIQSERSGHYVHDG